MYKTKKGYAKNWTDYRSGDQYNQEHGPATTYYRDADVLQAANHYRGKYATTKDLPDLNADWSGGMTFADFIRGTVEPYRVVR